MAMQGASRPGDRILPGQEPELASGVRGLLFDEPDGVFIPIITSDAATRGQGNVSHFLDSLPQDRRIVFPTVLSERLRDMLLRRGFRDVILMTSDGEPYEAMERQPVERGKVTP